MGKESGMPVTEKRNARGHSATTRAHDSVLVAVPRPSHRAISQDLILNRGNVTVVLESKNFTST